MSNKKVRPVPSVRMVSRNQDGEPRAAIERRGNNVRVTPLGQETTLSTRRNPNSYDPGKPADVSEE